MISMLTLLPALLAICGRRAFWPFDPARRRRAAPTRRTASGGGSASGRRAPAPRLDRARSRCSLVLALGLLNLNTGLTSGNGFRGDGRVGRRARSCSPSAFPAGATAPTDVIVPDAAQRRRGARRAARSAPGVADGRARRSRARRARASTSRSSHDPYSTPRPSTWCRASGEAAKAAGGDGALVGGADRAGVRPAPVGGARQPGDLPIALLVVFLILVAPAARAGRAAAADRRR